MKNEVEHTEWKPELGARETKYWVSLGMSSRENKEVRK